MLTKTPSMIKLKVTNCKLKYLFNCFNSVETFYVSVIRYNWKQKEYNIYFFELERKKKKK